MQPIKEVDFDRTYDASIDRVWTAWTDPEELKQWWGPDNVSIPECTVDLRVGGRFYIVMEAGAAMGPYAGTKWPMEAMYTVVEPQRKLAYDAIAWTEGQKEDTQLDQVTEVVFSEQDGKTRVQVKAAINKVGPGARGAVEGMQYGFTQQLAKLTKFLAG
jgi:uncharacterized protein YndB with AHSA1/START domain